MNRTNHIPPERVIRHIWREQHLQTDALQTSDGRRIVVFSPGEENPDSGPDFVNAVVKIGATRYRGDVEIHRTSGSWTQHGHQSDPRYNRVVLHVAFSGSPDDVPVYVESGRRLPLLMLEPFLLQPSPRLIRPLALNGMGDEERRLPCVSLNHTVSSQTLQNWLNTLAHERLQLKLMTLDERLRYLAHERSRSDQQPCPDCVNDSPDTDPDDAYRRSGNASRGDLAHRDLWDQLYYEGILEGLGYSKNRLPFLRLARALSLGTIHRHRLHRSRLRLQAALFGVAGLLPPLPQPRQRAPGSYVDSLHRIWKLLRPILNVELLHPADWVTFPVRPANVPARRMAAVPAIVTKLMEQRLFRNTVRLFKECADDRNRWRMLRSLFRIGADEYWRSHYNFGRPTTVSFEMLGSGRIDDILVNTVLPLVLLYAKIFLDADIRSAALSSYWSLPPVNSNQVTRFMEGQFAGDRLQIRSLASQQGILQLYGYYCIQRRCHHCVVGRRVFPDASVNATSPRPPFSSPADAS